MPRTNIGRAPFERMSHLILGYGGGKAVAKVLKSHPNTARSRLQNPDTLTLGELKKISQGLHIPIEDIRQAITW